MGLAESPWARTAWRPSIARLNSWLQGNILAGGPITSRRLGLFTAIAATRSSHFERSHRELIDSNITSAFVNLPANPDYTVSASKFGYLSGGYGRETDPTDPLRPIALKDNDWVSNIRVTIWKPGSISGKGIAEIRSRV